MAQPVRRPQDHRPLSARRDGDAGAVGRGTEPYALAELHRLRISQRNVAKQASRSARFSLVLPIASTAKSLNGSDARSRGGLSDRSFREARGRHTIFRSVILLAISRGMTGRDPV